MRQQVQIIRTSGIILMLMIGGIHFLEADDSFRDAAYKGWLFYANGLSAISCAYCICLGKGRWGWNLGLLIAIGSMAGYVASRTIGLPFIPAEGDAWFEPMGVAAMISEILFVVIFTIMSHLKSA